MSKQYKEKTGGRGIEWTDATINATGGCMHDCRWEMPDGTTAICYADEVATNTMVKSAYPHGFKHHYWRPAALKELSRGQEPELRFVDSMSDMFAPAVPEDQVRQILATMRKAPHHSYQSLTKAAPQLLKYLDDLPPNLWVGVSSPPDWFMGKRLSRGQQKAMLSKSLEVLAQVKEKTGNLVWMSAEPVSWDLTEVFDYRHPLDWIVIGAASSGPRYFQPDPEHIKNLLNVMDWGWGETPPLTTPVFYKGNIGKLFEMPGWLDMIDRLHPADSPNRARLNRWREDFPQVYRDATPIPSVQRRQQQAELHGWTRIALPITGPTPNPSPAGLFG